MIEIVLIGQLNGITETNDRKSMHSSLTISNIQLQHATITLYIITQSPNKSTYQYPYNCGGKSGYETGPPPHSATPTSTSRLPCHNHSTNRPYSFIHLSLLLRKLGDWKVCYITHLKIFVAIWLLKNIPP